MNCNAALFCIYVLLPIKRDCKIYVNMVKAVIFITNLSLIESLRYFIVPNQQ